MSLNDTPEMRRLFAGHHLRTVATTYTAGARAGQAAKKAQELLIANYLLTAPPAKG